jgi:hypothetical protein
MDITITIDDTEFKEELSYLTDQAAAAKVTVEEYVTNIVIGRLHVDLRDVYTYVAMNADLTSVKDRLGVYTDVKKEADDILAAKVSASTIAINPISIKTP